MHDPSNDDPRFRRNRVRHELLPLLNELAERDVAALLARTAGLLRDDDTLLDQLAAELDPTDALALLAAPLPLARRAVRRWLDRGGYPPDAADGRPGARRRRRPLRRRATSAPAGTRSSACDSSSSRDQSPIPCELA